MPIPIAQIPDMTSTQLGLTPPTAGAMAAPLQGASQLVRGIASVGTAFEQHTDRLQAMENTYLESEQRSKIAEEISKFEMGLDQNTDPSSYLTSLDQTLARTRSLTQDAKLPPAVRDKLQLHHMQVEDSTRIRTAERAAKTTAKRAGMALQNEMDAAITYRNRDAYVDALDRGVEAGMVFPEQRDQALTRYEQEDAYHALTAEIEADPEQALSDLQDDAIQQRYPHLTPENRERLTGYAAQLQNKAKAQTWEQLSVESLSGNILSREEITRLAQEGDISAAQAGSYIRAHHSPEPPAFEPLVYENARKQITDYDPANDPSGANRATLAANIATLPLPKEYIAELQDQYKSRITPTPEQAARHTLAKPYLERIESDWKAEAFGDWYDMEKDPVEGRISRKIIREKDFDQALSYQRNVQDTFLRWLDKQPAEIDPTEVGKKYDEIKTQVLKNQIIPDLAPPSMAPPPSYEDPLDGASLLPWPPLDAQPDTRTSQNDTQAAPIGTFGGQPVFKPGIPIRRAATSIFGGDADPEDNGLSANGGSNNATAGVAIPQKMLQTMFPGKDKAWHFANVKIVVRADNGTQRVLPLVDYGTAEWVTQREKNHKLDLNPKAVAALGGQPIYRNGKLTSHSGFQTVDFTITTDNAKNIDPKTSSYQALKSNWFADKKPTDPEQVLSGLTALQDAFYSSTPPTA